MFYEEFMEAMSPEENPNRKNGYVTKHYWYFTTHGVQPGSIPKDVEVIDIKDTPNGTYFSTDWLINTKELKEYDIKEKAPVNESFPKITRKMKNDQLDKDIEDVNNREDGVMMSQSAGFVYDSDTDRYYDIQEDEFLSIPETIKKIKSMKESLHRNRLKESFDSMHMHGSIYDLIDEAEEICGEHIDESDYSSYEDYIRDLITIVGDYNYGHGLGFDITSLNIDDDRYSAEVSFGLEESLNRKQLKESFDDETYFKAYITNLGKYNEGDLVGEWVQFPIDEDEFNSILESIGIDNVEYEEWFVTDYDCSLEGFDWEELGEYPGFEKLNEYGELVESITDVEAVKNVLEVTNSLEEAIEGLDNGDFLYISGIKNDSDLGEYVISEYGEDNVDIESYFDYEALGRDLSFDSYGEEDNENAGEYFCGDEDASNTEIGEAYVDEVGFEGVQNPENYIDLEKLGRDTSFDGAFTKDGFVFQF